MKTLSKYQGPEKNCGDRLKILNVQTWDMCDRHNLQVYEILSVIKTIISESMKESECIQLPEPKKAPPSDSSCGDDYKTRSKYKGPEKTLAACIEVCRHQIRDMINLDKLNAKTTFNLIKALVEYHIKEYDELNPED